MFDQHNNILVNNTGSVEGLEFLLNLENDHLMRPVGDFGSATGNMTEDFMNGKTAMIFDGPYDVKQILTGASFKDTANLGIAGIPTGAARQTGSPIGGQSYVISAKTSYPAQAYQFINFMNSASVQVAIAKLNHTLPTRLSAYQDGASSDRYISAFLSLKDTVAARPAIPQGAYLFDVSDTSIWAALTGQQSVNGALNAVADSWDQLGAGNLVPQSTFTHGALPSACG
jgi:arabinogalactan oligomer/maltooligosaccharide transport system substrate-binding protein